MITENEKKARAKSRESKKSKNSFKKYGIKPLSEISSFGP